MNITFEDKTALITGAAHGFGRAIALALAEHGARVCVCDVLADELAETLALCRAAGPSAHLALPVDVTDATAIRDFVAHCGPQVNILINNAGGVAGQVGRPLEQVTLSEWQHLFDLNVTAAFLFAQAVAPLMKAQNAGRIVNISSGAGLGISLTGIQAYASSKAAQIGLTRQLAHELGPFGITVNSIAPGFVRSNPNSERQWQAYGLKGQKALIEGIALRRLGTPQDIAHTVMFFASEQAGWITGQTLAVDGGK